MRSFSDEFVTSRKRLRSAAGFAALAVAIAFGLITAVHGRGQSQTQNTSANFSGIKFEVASVKPDKSSTVNGLIKVLVNPAPDGFSASGVNLLQLISIAYGQPNSFSLLGALNKDQLYFQNDPISRAPDWFRSERFNIDARMDVAAMDALQKLSPGDRNLARQRMLQALLAERFQLAVHRETKDLPVFALVIPKKGSKLREATPGDADSKAGAGRGGAGSFQVLGKGGPVIADAVSITALVQFLSRQPLGRGVIDKTGLTGKYDFRLQWTPDDLSNSPDRAPVSDSPWPSLFTALQEQLCLKLEPQKGPVETLVIDHAERPSGN